MGHGLQVAYGPGTVSFYFMTYLLLQKEFIVAVGSLHCWIYFGVITQDGSVINIKHMTHIEITIQFCSVKAKIFFKKMF